MINWKKAVGVTAAAAMLIPMAACGGNDNNSNGGASSAPAETQSVNLSVWSPQEDADWLKDMEAAFEKAHPEYKVTWKNSVVSEGDAAKTVQTKATRPRPCRPTRLPPPTSSCSRTTSLAPCRKPMRSPR